MIRAIYRHELITMFRTPLAWLLIGLCAALIAFQFLAQIEFYLSIAEKLNTLEQAPGVTELIVTPTLSFCAMLVILIVPVITMLAISGERKLGTVQLIASSPVNIWSYVIGKFLSLSTVFLVLWLVVAVMIFTLLWGTQLDFGLYAAGLFGLSVYTLSAVSIGLGISALLNHPIAAGTLCLVVLLFLWFCDWVGSVQGDVNFFSHFAASRHYNRIAGGLFDSFDIAYFLVLILFGLAVTHWRISNERFFG